MSLNRGKLKQLKGILATFPRVGLADLPTPLHYARRLTKALGGPRILIKREDLTGLACGGNKTRMFEYSLAQVVNEGYDTIIAGASAQSNYCRQIAAACAKLGLEAHLILRTTRGTKDCDIQGNLALDLLTGAKVRILVGANREVQIGAAEELAKELKEKGYKPYIARGLKESHIAYDAAAYVSCFVELQDQLSGLGEEADYVFVASNDSTYAGLFFGAEYTDASTQIVSIAPMTEVVRANTVVERVNDICQKVAQILNVEFKLDPKKIISTKDYVGEGYGLLSEECREAIKVVAENEGVLLDPVYSGKAMAGLIDKIRKNELPRDSTVVFVHTGGIPAIFAYIDELGLELPN